MSVSVTVTAVNEHEPIFNTPSAESLPENAVLGTSISSLVATDNDASPHDIVKYAISSGNILYV